LVTGKAGYGLLGAKTAGNKFYLPFQDGLTQVVRQGIALLQALQGGDINRKGHVGKSAGVYIVKGCDK
jgi:hypothetical protein